jgi:Tfp pilus assembly protein PilV
MKPSPGQNGFLTGATLIEAVIAVGVLAVAVPLVLGTIAEGGKSGMAAEAETRSTWMITACVSEINASRAGQSRHFPATITGQTFPPAGDVWALAFSPEGKLVGKLSKSQHDKGARELDGKSVRFIAVLSAAPQASISGVVPMLETRVSIQYPAAAPAVKRGKLDYHTLIP